MTTTVKKRDINETLKIDVPAPWAPLLSILGIGNNEQLQDEEPDLFLIRQFARWQLSSKPELKEEYKQTFYQICPEMFEKEDIILKLMKRLYLELSEPEKIWSELKNEELTDYAYRILQTAKRHERVKLPRGVWLIRTYKGKKYTVECLNTHYQYQGVYFTNLTEIAQLITGTGCSGPAFFKRKTEIFMRHR